MTQAQEDTLSAQFLENLCLIHNYLNRRTQLPIPVSQFSVLVLLDEDGPLPITSIAQHLMISKQQMTKVINRMSVQELIKKTPDPEDHRRTLISVLPKGRELLDDQTDVIRSIFLEDVKRLKKNDREELTRSLTSLNRLLSQSVFLEKPLSRE